MKRHAWTTGDGVEHVAYQCEECGRWFDSPSLHFPLDEQCQRSMTVNYGDEPEFEGEARRWGQSR